MIRYGWEAGGWDWGTWVLLALLLLLFWSIVIVLAVTAYRHLRSEHPTSNAAVPSQARQILDERFARGEIDAEEYRSRRDALDQR